MLDLGTTKREAAVEGEQSSGLIGRFKDLKDYRHRCLMGPKRRETVVYPTWRKSLETDEMYPSYNTVILPPSTSGFRSIFDSFSAIEKTIQTRHGIDRSAIDSAFNRTKRFIYVVLSRDVEVESGIWIGPWEYTATASKEVLQLQSEISTKNRDYLRYGPYWAYDIVIKKYVDEELMRKTKSRMRSTRYTVSVDPENMPLAGQVPIKVIESREWTDDNASLMQELYKKAFTPDELEVINSYEHGLDDFVRPINNNDELKEVLERFPINLDAVRSNNVEVFRFKNDLKEEISKFGDRLLAEYDTPKQLEESAVEESVPEPVTKTKATKTTDISKDDEELW